MEVGVRIVGLERVLLRAPFVDARGDAVAVERRREEGRGAERAAVSLRPASSTNTNTTSAQAIQRGDSAVLRSWRPAHTGQFEQAAFSSLDLPGLLGLRQ